LGLGAVRLEEKDNKFLLKSNSLKPQVSSLIKGNGDKSPYSRLFSFPLLFAMKIKYVE
jgi:hypothetical protein